LGNWEKMAQIQKFEDMLSSVVDPDPEPDPYSIGSVDPDPYSESGSGSRRAIMTHKSRKKMVKIMF
jgi:hypothetical protein